MVSPRDGLSADSCRGGHGLALRTDVRPNSSFHTDFSNDAAVHAKRVTIMSKDMHLMQSVIAAVAPHSALGSSKKK